MMSKISSSVLVILDLAYFEYVDAEDYVNANALMSKYSNLLITKTFQKFKG